MSIPWLILWLSNRASPDRALSLLEVGFYGVLMLYEVVLFVLFPKLIVESEGFAMLLIWGISMPVIIFVYLLSWDGRGRAARKDRGAR